VEGWFSRRGAVSAPGWQGRTHSKAFHYPRWVAGWPWPNGDMPRSSRSLPHGRAEPAPPRGASLGGRPCGGKPGNGAKGGFLGGAHSVRLHSTAIPELRDFTTLKGRPRAQGPKRGRVGASRRPSLRASRARPSATCDVHGLKPSLSRDFRLEGLLAF